jgi:hypothetical protein
MTRARQSYSERPGQDGTRVPEGEPATEGER